MSVDAHEVLDALHKALRDHEKRTKQGSIYVGGRHPAWYYDPDAKMFHRPFQSEPTLRVSTLTDGTFDLRDGQFQLRRLTDGTWLYRHGKETWQKVGL